MIPDPDQMANQAPHPAPGLVIFAKDKGRVSKFYQLALGLEVVESEKSHDLLRGKGIELVIHAIPDRIAAGIKIQWGQSRLIHRDQSTLTPLITRSSAYEIDELPLLYHRIRGSANQGPVSIDAASTNQTVRRENADSPVNLEAVTRT